MLFSWIITTPQLDSSGQSFRIITEHSSLILRGGFYCKDVFRKETTPTYPQALGQPMWIPKHQRLRPYASAMGGGGQRTFVFLPPILD